MPEIIHMETKRISARTYYGRFCVEPLPVGQGITLGNSLRRVLLGDLVGLAPTSANVAGAAHEFSTLPGIRESVLEILLNMKQIVFKQISSRPKDSHIALMRASLNVDGPATVTAKDLVVPAWMKVVDPSQYIATLSPGANLNLEIQLAQGTGYRMKRRSLAPPGLSLNTSNESSEPDAISNLETNSKSDTASKSKHRSDTNQKDKLESLDIDSDATETSEDQEHGTAELRPPSMADDHMTLHIDALFFPVTRVNYRVEEQVINGRRQEELMLEIWTNGSLSPRQALDQAAVTLIRMLGSLQAPPRRLPEPLEQSRAKSTSLAKDVSSTTIESLDLSVRSFNCLKRANITNVGKLISYSREELLQLKNFGTKSANEVVEILKTRFQLALKGEELPIPTPVSDEQQAVAKKKLPRRDKMIAAQSEQSSSLKSEDIGRTTKSSGVASKSTKSTNPKKASETNQISKRRKRPEATSTQKTDTDAD